MIVVQLTGGLGNQLFQYAFARHLALKNGSQLLIDISQIHSRSDTNHRRQYRLTHFRTDTPVIQWTSERCNKFKFDGIIYQKGSLKWIDNLRTRKPLKVLKEESFGFDPTALEKRGDFYVTTYWQSHHYFKDISGVIRSDLMLSTSLSKQHREIESEILDTPNSIALMVRRGDFANHPHHSKFHGCTSPSYYAQALTLAASKLDNPHVFIFSDDINWAKENIAIDLDKTYMDQDYDHERYDYVDLHFIRSCKHHIIANSTFGWWGAWLSAEPNQLVVSPRKWFRDSSIDTSDICPPSWIRI